MKLKNVHTGEVCDVTSISASSDLIAGKALAGFRFRGGKWETVLVQVQRPGCEPEVLWVPAKPGVDY